MESIKREFKTKAERVFYIKAKEIQGFKVAWTIDSKSGFTVKLFKEGN